MKRYRLMAMMIMVFAGIGGVLYGYDLGIIAGALLFIKKSIAMSMQQESFLAGAVLGGGAIATLITGPLADWFGRRKMIIAAAMIFVIGVLLLGFAHDYLEVMFGRVIQGIGVGVVTIAVPLFIAESLPSHLRGRGITVFQLLLTTGILLASIVGWFFAHSGNWRAMFLSATVPGILLLLGCLLLPDSPRWLVMRDRHDDALQALSKTRSHDQAHSELSEVKTALDEELNRPEHHVSLWQRRFMVPLAIVLVIAVLNQLTGINSVIQFSAVILQSAGIHSSVIDLMGSTIITLMNVLVTIIALLLIDKVGRRVLITWGTAGIVIFLILLGFATYSLPNGDVRGVLTLIGLVGFIASFAIGPGVLVWVLLCELLPARIRSKGMALALFVNSLASFALASLFLDLQTWLTSAGVFWLLAGFTAVYFLVAYYFVPETRNKSLEEIEHIFARQRA